jgi:transcriptional regulator with XRE-family HTH domain
MNNGQAPIDRQKLLMKRLRAGWSQAELARRAGLDPSYIRLLERGKRGPSPQTLGTLAEVFGCDITDLMPDEVAA